MKNKWLIPILSVALILASIVSVIFNRYNGFADEGSVITDISVKTKNTDSSELIIKYRFGCGGYSVRVVPEDEGEYIGDGMIDYDGALGKYRMMVDFGDIEPSTAIALRFAVAKILILQNQPIEIRAKIAHPSDHGFVLYLGFDKPISIDEEQGGRLNPVGGTIKIPISIN